MVFEKVVPDHPSVASSLTDLASLYQAQGRHTEAEPLFARALAIREKALVADHPDVVGSLENLAAVYRAMKRDEEAEILERRAVRGRTAR